MSKNVVVLIAGRAYSMTRNQFKAGIEPLARGSVPFGIYAVEKAGQIQMLKEHCSSLTQLKRKKREYTAKGFKVYANQEK